MPFSQLRVLELASVLAGPSVGQFFAELGAEVIKVENPSTKGDVTRSWKLTKEDQSSDLSAYFCSVNWGKKSIAVDIANPEGVKIIHELVRKCDVVIASYKPGDAEKLQVDYETLKQINPRLIYGHITGYGPDSPKVGYDAIVQAEAGFIYMNGEPQGNPVKMPVALMDILAAHQLKEGILISLYNQLKTGEGSYVTVSLIDAAVSSLANQATNWLVADHLPQRMGSEHPNIVPYGSVYKTADDKLIILAVGNDKQFFKLCEVICSHNLPLSEKFATNQARVANRVELNAVLIEKIAQWQKVELLDALEKAQIPAGGVNNLQEVFENDYAKALVLESFNDGQNFTGLRNFIAKSPFLQSERGLSCPPHLGQHSQNVLKNFINLDDEQINFLIQEKMIF
jgi:crotonobetainyl-CoA:carnitine CoA-transferase CaiB-like acyl-CoA transferase